MTLTYLKVYDIRLYEKAVRYRAEHDNETADELTGAFQWSRTPEGHDFWSRINAMQMTKPPIVKKYDDQGKLIEIKSIKSGITWSKNG